MSQFKGSVDDPRPPRVVRFGVTQNSIHLPTDAPIQDQIESLWDIHENFVEAAAAAGTNVLCFQEGTCSSKVSQQNCSMHVMFRSCTYICDVLQFCNFTFLSSC